jgi:UDP-GlcNAc:undecaprenyl-phosphate/decaprenyl-phosphate GlcNAc-1-phosphate transferase
LKGLTVFSQHLILGFLPGFLPPVAQIFLASGVSFALAYVLTIFVLRICQRFGLIEAVQEGKIHTVAVPRLGGIAIFAAFLFTSLIFYVPFLASQQSSVETIFGHTYPKELVMYVLFVMASLLIVIVHAYDDIKGLKPLPKLIAQTVAVLILLGPGLHTFHGVIFFGLHNPFATGSDVYNPALPWYEQSTLTLFMRAPLVSWIAIPAVIFTWFWIVGMMNTVNFIDGLDGLSAGVVAIAGLFITIISWTLQQHSIALLAAIFTGAIVGFLPKNWHPAKIIMGDSGSQFLGMGLAVLAVMGGAKFALILMLLGIPILDIAWVMINRIRRGQHPMQRDILPLHARFTHLHYRLLFGGLNPKQICLLLYGVTFMLGILTLVLPSALKLLGLLLMGVFMILLLRLSIYLQHRKLMTSQRQESQALH